MQRLSAPAFDRAFPSEGANWFEHSQEELLEAKADMAQASQEELQKLSRKSGVKQKVRVSREAIFSGQDCVTKNKEEDVVDRAHAKAIKETSLAYNAFLASNKTDPDDRVSNAVQMLASQSDLWSTQLERLTGTKEEPQDQQQWKRITKREKARTQVKAKPAKLSDTPATLSKPAEESDKPAKQVRAALDPESPEASKPVKAPKGPIEPGLVVRKANAARRLCCSGPAAFMQGSSVLDADKKDKASDAREKAKTTVKADARKARAPLPESCDTVLLHLIPEFFKDATAFRDAQVDFEEFRVTARVLDRSGRFWTIVSKPLPGPIVADECRFKIDWNGRNLMINLKKANSDPAWATTAIEFYRPTDPQHYLCSEEPEPCDQSFI